MIYNQTELDNEIHELHFKIEEQRKAFNEGMKQDIEFGELRKIYAGLKELDKRLELCFQEANALRES